jgi:hypothetical protein
VTHSILRLSILLLICADLMSAFADVMSQYEYSVKPFGEANVVIMLKGDRPQSLSLISAADGKTIRISGVDARFIPAAVGQITLIRSIRQVRRGRFQDLIINLSQSAAINASVSGKSLQIVVKGKKVNEATVNTTDLRAVKD